MVEVKTISQAIEILGKGIYGDKFHLSKNSHSAYKKVFESISSEKGVFIIGSIGVGKTACMKVLQRLFKDTDKAFKWVSAYELKDLSEQITMLEIKELYGYNLKCNLYIDDIGFSVDVKRYGTTVNVITEIVMERYDLFVSSGYKTHFSSNIVAFLKNDNADIPTIQKIYGNRVLDRIKEMCELITWVGESQRK